MDVRLLEVGRARYVYVCVRACVWRSRRCRCTPLFVDVVHPYEGRKASSSEQASRAIDIDWCRLMLAHLIMHVMWLYGLGIT